MQRLLFRLHATSVLLVRVLYNRFIGEINLILLNLLYKFIHQLEKFQNKYRIPSTRLIDYDYTNNGYYFITICTQGKKHFFGEIINNAMNLNTCGIIAQSCWLELPKHTKHISLAEFVVMPNHVHGILIIDKTVETLHATSAFPQANNENIIPIETLHTMSAFPNEVSGISNETPTTQNQMSAISPKANSISSAVRSYKSAVTKAARNINSEFNWQARFHDHIIRNDESYLKISDYIVTNPSNWIKDIFYDEV